MHAGSDLDVEVARWLVGPDGLAAVASATNALDEGTEVLAVAARLASGGLSVERRAAAVDAAVARRRARPRWPRADHLLFTRTGLEQASDPRVSAWRARRFDAVDAVEDRAAGIGGDTLALAATGAQVTAIDRDAGRLELLRHNLAVHGHAVDVVVADATVRPPPTIGPVHVDPGRRDGERRLRRLAEHRPSVPVLLDHLSATVSGPGVAVVLSPAVDLADPDLPTDAEVEFVQIGPDLVEAVAWTGALRSGSDVAATATLLDRDGRLVATSSRGGARPPRLPVGPVGDVVVEIAPAAVRARLHDTVGAAIGARRVAERRALLTADGLVPASPWWVARPVETVLPLRASAVRRWLRTTDGRPVELVRHGVDTDLDAFRREVGGPPGGPDGWRLELVRTDDGALVVVTGAGTGVPT